MNTKQFPIDKLRGRSLFRLRQLFPQVKFVQDSNVAVEIPVTSNDQAVAVPNEPAACALAKACVRELEIDGAMIGLATAYLVKGDRAIRFITPETTAREIVSFDRHGDFATGSYRLARVPKTRTLGYTRPLGPSRTGREAKRPAKAIKTLHHTARVRQF